MLDIALFLPQQIVKKGFLTSKNVVAKAVSWDFVTEYDQASEKFLISGLTKAFPTHKFIGEETVSGSNEEPVLTEDPTWVIDPIDGTTNFVHGFPLTCISIALAINKEVVLAIVYNPVYDHMFTARKGQGACLNGERIYASKETGKSLPSPYKKRCSLPQAQEDVYQVHLCILQISAEPLSPLSCHLLETPHSTTRS